MKLVAGTSNYPLAKKIAHYLNTSLTNVTIQRFSNNEIFVEILESVQGEHVCVIQSTSNPTNDHVMELLLMIDTLKRGGALQITACIPYFGYARQDRTFGPGTSLAVQLVANLLTTAGAHRILTLDLHAPHIQEFFDIPVHNLSALSLFQKEIKTSLPPEPFLVVSPDAGGIERARILAKELDCDLAVLEKRRIPSGKLEITNLFGEVQGFHCLLIDDIVDSGRTLCAAANVLINKGALSACAYITHGVLSPSSLNRIEQSCLQKVVITDSIQHSLDAKYFSKIQCTSTVSPLGEAIRRIS